MLEGMPTSRNYWGLMYIEASDYDGPAPWDENYTPEDKAREEAAPVVPQVYWQDFWLTEGHHYWKGGRFYVSTGCSEPDVINPSGCAVGCLCEWCDLDGALTAARSARFEHGDTPRRRAT